MNASFIGSKLLATGQSAPFTGDWISIAEARNALFVVYGSGVSGGLTATVQSKTFLSDDPAFTDDGGYAGVPLYSFNSVSNGYASPVFLDSPVPYVRLVVTGNGNGQVWSYASIQN
jgi:hypothetical protein